LAEEWAGPAGFAGTEVVRRGYQVWNALIFSVVGFVPLAPALANAAIGGASVILVYRISEPLAGVAAARISALLVAFFPSLVLWSSLNLKDAFAILSILVALRGAQRLAERIEPQGAAMLAAGILGLAQLRGYLVVLLVASTAVAVLLPRVRGASAPAVLTAWLALCALSVALPGRIENLAERPALEVLGEHRRNLALGASAYHGDVDISTPGAAAKFLPVGLAYFLLAPAPWQLLNARQLLTLPEMLTWYALLPQVFFGLRHTLRRRLGAGLGIATFACLATVSYALVESNLGTAYRHRAQVLTLYLIFAAVGIATRHARRARARPPRAREPALA
jgi:4-amino-4-deoxy-L-arabinose transferase-like glycosyltransferase